MGSEGLDRRTYKRNFENCFAPDDCNKYLFIFYIESYLIKGCKLLLLNKRIFNRVLANPSFFTVKSKAVLQRNFRLAVDKWLKWRIWISLVCYSVVKTLSCTCTSHIYARKIKDMKAVDDRSIASDRGIRGLKICALPLFFC